MISIGDRIVIKTSQSQSLGQSECARIPFVSAREFECLAYVWISLRTATVLRRPAEE